MEGKKGGTNRHTAISKETVTSPNIKNRCQLAQSRRLKKINERNTNWEVAGGTRRIQKERRENTAQKKNQKIHPRDLKSWSGETSLPQAVPGTRGRAVRTGEEQEGVVCT